MDEDLTPGFTFTWEYANEITADSLEGIDVLMVPGGGGANQAKEMDIPAVQEFVANGGGYYGTCGGHWAALEYADGGATPGLDLVKINTGGSGKNGTTSIRLTEWGARTLGYGGYQLISKSGGSASYNKKGLKCFADLSYYYNNVGRSDNWRQTDYTVTGPTYKHATADYYGQGRVIVLSCHPEKPRHKTKWFPKWVGAGVIWCAGHDYALDSYTLGFDRGYKNIPYDSFSRTADSDMICQREYASASGTISTISLLKTGGSGNIIVGVYTGEDNPKTCVAQSDLVPASSTTGWQHVPLRNPYPVKKGQHIWLAFMFEDTNQEYYYVRFSAEEKLVWASSAGWSDLVGSELPDSPSGSVKDYRVCLFAQVSFDNTPVAGVDVDTRLGYAPLTVSFSGAGSMSKTTIRSYEWDFGDGTTASGSTVQHTYDQPGKYVVSLAVEDRYGTDSESVTVDVVERTPGLIMHLTFEDIRSGVVVDSSGNGNDMYITGAQATQSRQGYGSALDFDGKDDHLQCFRRPQRPCTHCPTSLDIGTGSYTVNAWIYPEETDNSQSWNNVLFASWHKDYFWFSLPRWNYAEFRYHDDGDDITFDRYRAGGALNAGHAFTQGSWQMVTFVLDRAEQTLKVYHNGDCAGVFPFNRSIAGVEIATSRQTRVASYRGNRFHGKIDELRVYNRALSPREILDVYGSVPRPAEHPQAVVH